MHSSLRIYEHPRLRNPSLVVGWSDAGFVGTSSVDYLTDKLGGVEFAEIEPHDFYLLPDSVVKAGVLQGIEYPESIFYCWENKRLTEDLIIFGGKPPDLNHYEFAGLILDLAELFKVKRIYTVGGTYANISHTQQPEVFAIVNNPRLKKYLTAYEVEPGNEYHGTASMNGLLLGLAKYRKIEGISLWGQVPSYLGDIPNPAVCEAVLRVLATMLDIDFDFSEIEADVRQSVKQINELVNSIREQDPDLDRHIEKLEKGIITETTEEERRRLFRELDEFLRKQKGRGEG
ncbi:MAG: PAC2 family protein [Chloroflexota bacterium]